MPELPEYKIAGSPTVAGFIVHRNMRSPRNLVPTKYKGCSQREEAQGNRPQIGRILVRR